MRNLHQMLLAMSLFVSALFTLPLLAQDDPNCTGAPLPQLTVGGGGRVTPGDPNNVRDIPSRSGAKTGEIPGGEAFTVLEGPVCTDGLNWWRVNYNGLEGWTVEGAGTDYWVEPYDPNAPTPTNTPTPLPTYTPAPTGTPRPLTDFVPPVEVVNHLEIGARVRVINDDPDAETTSISLRAEPGTNSDRIGSMDEGALGTITDGPQEADNLRWWKVKADTGREGWAIEGLVNEMTQLYERTLLPVCPLAENRITYVIDQYLHTVSPDLQEFCILDHLRTSDVYTFWPYFTFPLNRGFWSPDGTQFAFVDRDKSDYNLYIMSADGSQRRQITQNSQIHWVDWSPDGKRLLISRTVGSQGGAEIWALRPDGSNMVALTDSDIHKPWAEWLADSETVIYAGEIGVGPSQMHFPEAYLFATVSVREAGLHEIFRESMAVTSVHLSPDRSNIAFAGFMVSDRNEPGDSRFFIINLNTDEVIYDSNEAVFYFLWAQDGTQVVLFQNQQIQTVPIPEGEPTIAELETDFFTMFEDYGFMGWSPDGTAIRLVNDYTLYDLNHMTGEIQPVT
jgi:hypothetical protein